MLDQWYDSLGFTLKPEELILVIGLVMARTMPLLFFNPFMGGKLVPAPVKMATAFSFVVIMLPTLANAGVPMSTGPVYAALLLKEVVIGATLGFLSSVVFFAFSSSGRLVDIQRGTNMAESMVYQLQERSSVFGNFYLQTAIMVFLIAGGHLLYIRAYFHSLEVLPVWEFPTLGDNGLALANEVIRITADFWVLAVKLAAPALIALFLTDVGFGIINRASPQVNVFIVSQPAKVAVGVILVLIILRVLFVEFELAGRDMLVHFYRIADSLGR